jgi:hypothetical protein
MKTFFTVRTSMVVALVAFTIAIVAVMFPGIGLGETSTFRGGPPSDVFMNTDTGVCNGEDKVGPEPADLLPTAVQVGGESDLLVYFTSTWSAPSGSPTELLLSVQIEGEELFATSPEWIANTGTGGSERDAHGVGTVMWSFRDVAAGDYTVEATGHIAEFPGTNSQSGANLQACALTVFAMPVVE